MKFLYQLLYFLFLAINFSCSSQEESLQDVSGSLSQTSLNYLALGDSYTIGQSVCSSCGFPEQLKDSLNINREEKVAVQTIAVTGWTTADLLNGIGGISPDSRFDLVTLLIGVNNQFQGISFSVYETEFNLLLDQAVAFAGDDASKVLVLSIPDYAYTPFGENRPDFDTISQEINQYNDFARAMTISKGATFEDITSISRQGLNDTSLIASDGLHLSAKAYSLFVDQIYSRARSILTTTN